MSDDQTTGPNEPTRDDLTYGRYLKVHELMSLQDPLSQPEQHDEMLFIVIHQVYELWFKQILHEVGKAGRCLEADKLMPFIRQMKRVNAIQEVLTHQVSVLETMTPVDFNTFRDRLNPASGFQSYQFREVEFRLGLKDRRYLRFYRQDPKALAALEKALEEPTLYDKFLRLLARRGFSVPAEVLERDVSQGYTPSEGVEKALLQVYRNADQAYELYLALEALIDLDENFFLWRSRHVAMVERMIGSRKGTGGSSGVGYLTKTLEKRFFPEIWMVRNWLGEAHTPPPSEESSVETDESL